MNASTKIARHGAPGPTTMTSREFNQHTGRAKAAADRGPVIITDRGKPSYVLLSNRDYERLGKKEVSIAEALADPNASGNDLDLMDFIPRRAAEPSRFSFDEEE